MFRKRAGRGSIYDLRECLLAYIDLIAHSPKTEATRLQQARRDKLELETERLRGEPVSAADVRTEWAALLTKIRGSLLSVPSPVGESAPHLSLADIELVDRANRDTLTEAPG